MSMPKLTSLNIAEWPRAGYVPPASTRTPLFAGLRSEVDAARSALNSVVRDACVHGHHECTRCNPPAAAPVAQAELDAVGLPKAPPWERVGWSLVDYCDGEWSGCMHYAGAPGVHLVNGSIVTTRGMTVDGKRIGIGKHAADRELGEMADAQLHVERSVAKAAEPSHPRVFKRGDRVRCTDSHTAVDTVVKGEVYTIERATVGSVWLVGHQLPWGTGRFELVQP